MRSITLFLILSFFRLQASAQDRPDLEATFEIFAIPNTAKSWLETRNLPDHELYQSLLQRVKNAEGHLSFFHTAVLPLGKAFLSKNSEEFIYPSDLRGPEGIPYPPSLNAYQNYFVPIFPSSYLNRFLGTEIQFTSSLDLNLGLVELNYQITQTSLEGLEEWGHEPSKFPTPKFGEHSFSGINSVKPLRPTLLAAFCDSHSELHFCFVTTKIDGMTPVEKPFLSHRANYEIISVPIQDASKLSRNRESLHHELMKNLDQNQIRLERSAILRIEPRTFSRIRSGSDSIYPTEYDPESHKWSQPQTQLELQPLNSRIFPLEPQGFDIRFLGDSLELHLKSVKNQVGIVALGARHSRSAGRSAYGDGISRDEKPQDDIEELRSDFAIPQATPTLLGTVTPRTAKDRVWWAFLTLSQQ